MEPLPQVEDELTWADDRPPADGERAWWRRHRAVVAAAGAAGALLAAVAVAQSPLLDVDDLEVEGAARTPVAEVLDRAGLAKGQAMLGLDDEGAAARVEVLPWVRSASVERRWPGRVVVEVQEREPVAALAAGRERWVLVDAGGRRLEDRRSPEPPDVPVRGLPSPSGPLGTTVGAAADGAVTLSDLLPDNLRIRLPEVRVDGDGRLSVELTVDDRRVQGVLGRPERLRAKVISLATVIDTVDPERLVRIDLRRPSEPVLTRA